MVDVTVGGTGMYVVAVTVSVMVSVDGGNGAMDVVVAAGLPTPDTDDVVVDVIGMSGGAVAVEGRRSKKARAAITTMIAAAARPMIQTCRELWLGPPPTGIASVESSDNPHALAVSSELSGGRGSILKTSVYVSRQRSATPRVQESHGIHRSCEVAGVMLPTCLNSPLRQITVPRWGSPASRPRFPHPV